MKAYYFLPYRNPDHAGPLVVMREQDMKGSFAETVEAMTVPELFFVAEEIDVPEGAEMPLVSMTATQDAERMAEVHRNMAILYYWDAAQLRIVRDGGFLSTTEPAPLSVERVAFTLRQLAKHPDYRGQRVTCHAEGMVPVVLDKGKVRVEQSS